MLEASVPVSTGQRVNPARPGRGSAVPECGAMTVRVLALSALLLAARPAGAAPGVDIMVRGVDGELRTNIEQRLAIRDLEGRKDLDDALVQRLHLQAESDIRSALQPFGYYSPQVSSELAGAAPKWKAQYTVEAGPPTLVERVDLQLTGAGAEFPSLLAALQRPPLREGRVLNHVHYEETKTRLAQAAYAGGFLDAQFTRAELRVNPSERRAEALLTLETGPRYFFGPVTIEQEGLRPEFVERYVRIVPGGAYDPQQVLDTQFALTDLDYFQTVEILPQRDRVLDGHIPITIRTTPRPRRRYEFGVGYGTDTGARVSAGVEFRRLNQSGHKLRLDARLSEIKTVLGGEYRIPLGDKTTESVSLTASSIAERFEDGESLKYVLGASLNRTPGSWQRRVYLNLEHEESDIAGVTSNADLLLPGVSFNRGEMDDPIHTLRGWNFFVDVHGAHSDFLSTATFLQTRVQLRGAYPLGRRVRLLGRAEIGASAVDDFSDLPASQRFYAGGDQSVRGYAYQSLGPRDANGKVVGGRYLTVLGLESHLRVWNNWGAAAFVDVGGADDDPWPELSRGAGVGLRYRAPIGYLNLDVGWPLDDPGANPRLHLGVRVGL